MMRKLRLCEEEEHYTGTKDLEREKSFLLPLTERERELNIVPRKYSSGIYPELISVET